MSRQKLSLFNFGSSLVLQIATLAIGIISTPLLLQWLGDERYGAFRAASDWGAYIGLLEFGISGSLMSLLAQAIGEGKRKKILLTIAAGIRAYLSITGLMLVAGIVLGLKITDLVPVPADLATDLQQGYWIGMIALASLPLTPFQLLADAGQRSYLTNLLFIVQSLLITGTGLILAWQGWGITGQYIALVIGVVCFRLLMAAQGLKRYPQALQFINQTQAQQPIKTRLWALNRSTFLLRLSGQFGLLSDNIIISYFLSPAAVVPFFITQRLPSLAQSQLGEIGNATWAALADLYAKGELDTFNTRLVQLSRLVSVMAVTLLLPIFIYNQNFVTLWVGGDRFGGNLLTLLVVADAFILGQLSLWGWAFGATANQPILVPISILSSSVNFIASLVCTHFFGIIGPVLGTLIGFTTVSIWWLPLKLRSTFGIPVKSLGQAVLQPAGIGIPYGILLWLIYYQYQPQNWISLALAMIFSAGFYLLLAWMFILSNYEKNLLRQKIPSLKKRKF